LQQAQKKIHCRLAASEMVIIGKITQIITELIVLHLKLATDLENELL
jgi:hypothetical protein